MGYIDPRSTKELKVDAKKVKEVTKRLSPSPSTERKFNYFISPKVSIFNNY